MVGRWPDGSTRQINLTVEAFRELTWAEAMERALYQEAVKDSASNRGANTDAISDAGFVGEKGDEGRGLPVVATTKAMANILAGKASAQASAAEEPLPTRCSWPNATRPTSSTKCKTARFSWLP
jgi:hypothetical protein